MHLRLSQVVNEPMFTVSAALPKHVLPPGHTLLVQLVARFRSGRLLGGPALVPPRRELPCNQLVIPRTGSPNDPRLLTRIPRKSGAWSRTRNLGAGTAETSSSVRARSSRAAACPPAITFTYKDFIKTSK